MLCECCPENSTRPAVTTIEGVPVCLECLDVVFEEAENLNVLFESKLSNFN